ncbi:MAG: TRAP transporter large permease subunit, partial [Acetobacteraceae bacterium]
FFLDFFEIAFIVVPLLVPTAVALGVDLVWFGVMLCVNMQTSFLHPPFGFALFYLRGVAPKTVLTKDIYLGAIPFLCLQLVLVGILIAWPDLVTAFLPRGTGVDPASVIIEAPPPPDPSAAPPIIFN